MNAQLALPLARTTDPITSHAAAENIKGATGPMMDAIEDVMRLLIQPVDAFQIAENIGLIHGSRWQSNSIHSAVSRHPNLRYVDDLGSHKGRSVRRYVLRVRGEA